MKIEVKAIKDITPGIRKEMVWRELGRVQDIISYLYQDKDAKEWKFDDAKMREIFYTLNDFCIDLVNDEDMEWQLKEKEDEHTDNA